jgi:hypothetical protein
MHRFNRVASPAAGTMPTADCVDAIETGKYNAARMSTTAAILPRWIRACDVAAVALIILGVSIVFTGGFRERTAIGVFSMTSPLRPVLIGFVILLIRHGLHSQPWIGARIIAAAREWRSTPDGGVIPATVVTTRFGVLIVGFLGIALIGYAPNTPPYRVYDNDFLNLPARWDTGWYLGIAEKGYSWDPAYTGMQNIAFFPAFPIAMRYGGFLVGRHRLWAGVLISLVSFFFALKYFYRLAREMVGDDAAAAAVLFISAYPFAFFFSTAYTESLFLLATVGACFHFQRDELWKAGAWGLLAGLVRPNGCFLSVVLALLALRRSGWQPVPAIAPKIIAAAMPGIGMLLYSAYIYQLTGNPFQWAEAHAAFGRVYRSFDPLVERVRYIQNEGLYAYASGSGLDMVNAVAMVFAVAAVWPVYRRFGLPYAMLIVLNVVPPVLMGGVLSMGRISSVMFPLFLWLGAAVPTHQRTMWLMAFSMLQALGAITFFTWRPLV